MPQKHNAPGSMPPADLIQSSNIFRVLSSRSSSTCLIRSASDLPRMFCGTPSLAVFIPYFSSDDPSVASSPREIVDLSFRAAGQRHSLRPVKSYSGCPHCVSASPTTEFGVVKRASRRERVACVDSNLPAAPLASNGKRIEECKEMRLSAT